MFTTLLWVLGVCAVVGWVDAACRQSPEWIDLTKRWAEPVTAPPKAAKTETAPKKRKVLKPAPVPVSETNPLDVTFEWDGIT